MKFDKILDILKRRDCVLVSDFVDKEHFGNRIAIVEGDAGKIRVVDDRGTILVSFQDSEGNWLEMDLDRSTIAEVMGGKVMEIIRSIDSL